MGDGQNPHDGYLEHGLINEGKPYILNQTALNEFSYFPQNYSITVSRFEHQGKYISYIMYFLWLTSVYTITLVHCRAFLKFHSCN